jgi:DNA replication protein DnaC
MDEPLNQHLKSLNLLHMLVNYEQEAQESVQAGDSYICFLCKLTDLEIRGRQNVQTQQRLRKAKFPTLKTLENFDFSRLPHLNKQEVLSLMQSPYVASQENIIALGNAGTGKTHVAIALGVAACQKGYSVLFQTAAQLAHSLLEAHASNKLINLENRLRKFNIIIIDELGYVPFSKTGAELLFEVFSQAYEQRSLIVTSNLPFEEWTQVFGCPRLTGALLDRLTHHAHILAMNGPSFRLSDRLNEVPKT